MGGEDNPWPDLAGQAHSGSLKLEPGTVEELAEAAGKLIGRMRAVRKEIDAVEDLPPFSGVESGKALASKMSAKAVELREILGKHIDAVNDMADVFVAAGKAYSYAEQLSVDKLNHISMPTSPGKFDVEPPEAGSMPVPSERDLGETDKRSLPSIPDIELSDDSADYQGKKEPTTVQLEAPESKSYEWFYELGQGIETQLVADAAGIWLWMAEELTDQFGTFVNSLVAVESLWEGAGADAAIGASRNYSTESEDLIESMKWIGSNLYYTAEWLENTASQMPDSPTPPSDFDGSSDPHAGLSFWPDDMRTECIDAINSTYVPGLECSDSVVPVLPLPVPPTEGAGQTGGTAGAPTSMAGSAPTGEQMPSSLSDPIGASGVETGDAAGQTGQQGMGALQQLGQQAAGAAQDAARAANEAMGKSVPPGTGVASGLAGTPGLPRNTSAGTGGSGTRGSGTPSASTRPPGPVKGQASQFPRASAAGPAATGRAGAAPGSANPGAPGPAGAGRGGSQGNEREHKRPTNLDSAEHLDEAIGAPQLLSKPVVDQ